MPQDDTPQRSKRSRAASTSDEISSSTKKRRKLSHSATAPLGLKSNNTPRSVAVSKAAADAYDVPDSDEERPLPTADRIRNAPKPRHGQDDLDPPQSDSDTLVDPGSPTSKKPGHSMNGTNGKTAERSKGKATPKLRAPKTTVESIEGQKTPNGTTAENGSAVRSSGRRRVPTTKAVEGQDFIKRARLDGSASRSRSTSIAVGTPQAPRFQDAPGSKATTPLKSILTPSKRDGDKRRKSVAFGGVDGTKTPGMLFADIPKNSVKKRKPNGTGTPKLSRPKEVEAEPEPEHMIEEEQQQEEVQNQEEQVEEEVEQEAEEEEESVCSVCSKPSSRKGNEILFCDGCDMAVHQRCYGVAEIPDGDWYCKKCAAAREAKAAATARVPNFEAHLRSMQRVLLDRCTGMRRIKLIGQDDAHDKAHQLVEQTVLAGEGNSMLVIGARGSGKTTLVETIIADLAREHRQIFHTVRLNGFIHTDDKLALKEIWRQLGKEMDVGEEATAKSNYADTMASLLALLSHPSEISSAQEGVTSKAVVFVIDEFDMFAAHPRQTLLYNLFDIAQARKAPIAVLGCTTRMDVVEMLEKRVKSRFSHRYVYLAQPMSLPAYWQVCRQGLVVDDEDAGASGLDVSLDGYGEFLANWGSMIEGLYKEPSFQNLLRYHYYTSKSVASFLTACILPLSQMQADALRIDFAGPSETELGLAAPNSKLHLLASLSELDLGLLIAAARLDIVAHTDTVNFAMAYDEYGSLMGRQRVQSATAGMLAIGGGARVWGRGVAGLAWERLISLGLLLPAGFGGKSAAAGGHGGLEGRMWKVDVALEDIPAGARLNQVLARWCKEI